MTLRIAVVGGGPGGLFLATRVKRLVPSAEVTVFERNTATDAFGFGVVFSDATLRKIDQADPVLRDALASYGRHWDRIEVWNDGQTHGFSGNGMAAIHRKLLLRLLQENAVLAGAELRFNEVAPSVAELSLSYDVVVGADGAHSAVRRELDLPGHVVETAKAKFIWFGTSHVFDGLTFIHRVSEHGNFAAHAYPISDDISTFIVEADQETWNRAGLSEFDVLQPPGPSDVASQRYLERLFTGALEGAPLLANNSRWGNFQTRRSDTWYQGNVVLLGDAVHTAHFSVGAGTKMAMEDAIALSAQLVGVGSGSHSLASALLAYQNERSVAVRKVQDSARPSLAWWERFGFYQRELDPTTFAFHFFSRSIGMGKIAERDPKLVDEVQAAWQARHGASPLDSDLEVVVAGSPIPLNRMSDDLPQAIPRVDAPADEAGLEDAVRRLPTQGAVAIDGPAELPKVLLSETARLHYGLTTFLVGAYDKDEAETLILAGRSDGVLTTASADSTPDSSYL